ncbi:MAG: thioredoxin family protein [Pirellulaceae bacterium]
MVSLLLAAVLASVTSEPANNHDYKAAYKESVAQQKPLMVVVGAEWCTACNVLKDTTIHPMVQTGELDGVSVAVVDRDAQPELCEQLCKGEKMLPQIIVFTQNDDGKWERKKLMGYQPKQPVRKLVAQAVSKVRG